LRSSKKSKRKYSRIRFITVNSRNFWINWSSSRTNYYSSM